MSLSEQLGLPSASELPLHQATFVFEATQRCNHDCLHCYNVWKGPGSYPTFELGTAETLALLGRMLDETRAGLVTLSGGEPLLREDIHEILAFLSEREVRVNLISNGSLLDEEAVERLLPYDISIFELPLLSCDREVHDAMSGSKGAFDRVTMAMACLKEAEQMVVGVFVATRLNLPSWRETAELAVAMGIDGIMFNRFNPGGRGIENLEKLQAPTEDLSEALDAAQEISETYSMPVSCSIPMPPCLFPRDRWPRLGFGFCSAGTVNAYYTLDPAGNVRPCNHSPTILGNLLNTPFHEMVRGDAMRAFFDARPAFCSGCGIEEECKGGCKAAAEVCFGSPAVEDPFLAAFKGEARKPYLGSGLSF